MNLLHNGAPANIIVTIWYVLAADKTGAIMVQKKYLYDSKGRPSVCVSSGKMCQLS